MSVGFNISLPHEPGELELFAFAESAEAAWAALAMGLTPGQEPPWELARHIHR